MKLSLPAHGDEIINFTRTQCIIPFEIKWVALGDEWPRGTVRSNRKCGNNKRKSVVKGRLDVTINQASPFSARVKKRDTKKDLPFSSPPRSRYTFRCAKRLCKTIHVQSHNGIY